MNFIFPILAAVLQASSFTLDKVILSMRRISFKTYIGISFPLSFLIILIIYLIFRTPFSWELLSNKLSLLILISSAMSIVSNLLYYRALDSDRLGELETLGLLAGVPVILFSGLVFADERNFFILVPALISSAAVVWSHWEQRHFQIAKKTKPFFIWILLSAPIGASISKLLLESWNPVSLELIRTGIIGAFFLYLFNKNAEKVSLKAFVFLFFTNILTTVAWLLFYFSYQRSGIVYTALLFSIHPLLVYLSAIFFLKEKFNHKKIIAFVIVLISIAIAQLLT